MEHRNAETIRTGFNAFMIGDMKTAKSIFHPDVIWHVPGEGPLSGDLRGFDAIAHWGSELVARTGGKFGEELVSILANDDWAIQLARYHAERDGRTIEDFTWNVYRMVDGQVAECWVGFADLKGFLNFWA